MQKRSIQDLARLSVADFKTTSKSPIVVILDNLRSALNVGAAFRTADAFLVKELALCGITAKPPHREILKTAIGASKSVDWRPFETTMEAVDYYRAAGYFIAAVEQAEGSTLLHQYKASPQQPIALVIGNEVMGVDQAVVDAADGCLEIPQFGTKHSFNVSVSLGMILWQLFQDMRPDLLDT